MQYKLVCHLRSPSGQTCDFEWIRKTWNVTTTSCRGLEHKASFAGELRKKVEAISSRIILGDYDRNECGIRVEGAGSGDEGLWTCAMEYYKFGGGKGSSRILKKDTYVHVVSPTTTTTTTTTVPTFTVRGRKGKILEEDLRDNALPTTKNLATEVSFAKFVAHAISILVVVIFVVLFTLIVVLHKLKNVRQQQQQREVRQTISTARSQVEAELAKLPDVNDVMFLKNIFPHVMRLPSDDLGLNL